MTSLCGVWWCSNTIFYGQYPTQVKEELIWNDILCLNGRRSFGIHVHSHGIARRKYYGAITKRMNFNCPVAETNESIEPNDNNLELKAIAYTFSKIDSNLNYNTEYARSFGDRELLAFSSEANGETKKKEHFLCCGRFHSVAVAFRNTKTRREDETKGPNRQRNKTFLEKHCQNKTSKPH